VRLAFNKPQSCEAMEGNLNLALHYKTKALPSLAEIYMSLESFLDEDPE
jgi:hypothetical protein